MEKRPNVEFVSKAYSKAELSEIFVVEALNSELERAGIKNFKFFHKDDKRGIDILLKHNVNGIWDILWLIDVHECQFGPPEGGRWPWPLHLPHGVNNINNPFRYKSRFENLNNFSIILVDKRVHGKWTSNDIVLVTKNIISKSKTEEVESNTAGHYRKEPMYFIPYNLLESFWGAKKCAEWFLEQKIIK